MQDDSDIAPSLAINMLLEFAKYLVILNSYSSKITQEWSSKHLDLHYRQHCYKGFSSVIIQYIGQGLAIKVFV